MLQGMMTMPDDRKQLELTYQAARAAKMAQIGATPAYKFERYRKNRLWRLLANEFILHQLRNSAGKKVLDFGCGEGTVTVHVANFGGQVTAMDLSPELIEVAERRAQLDGMAQRIQFKVGDILELPPPKNTFDYVLCSAVLHHVDLYRVVPVLLAALKPGVTAIFLEPIAFSPALQRVRDSVPVEKDASPDERQLNRQDIRFICAQLVNARITYFNLFGRLSRLLPNVNKIDKGHAFTKAALIALLAFDRVLLTGLPFLRKYSGTVVITGQKR